MASTTNSATPTASPRSAGRRTSLASTARPSSIPARSRPATKPSRLPGRRWPGRAKSSPRSNCRRTRTKALFRSTAAWWKYCTPTWRGGRSRSPTPSCKPPQLEPAEAISSLQPVAGLEDPPHDGERAGDKRQDGGHADLDIHVGEPEKAPAEPADQIDDGVEQRDRPPERRQHVGRIKCTAEECQRRDDQERRDLQLVEA